MTIDYVQCPADDVPERITFKVATLTYRALHGFRPPYLASSFTRVHRMPHRRRLRSASTEQLDVPTCRLSHIGARAFPVAWAKVWNNLPSDVTSASSLAVFKNRLKTYFFRRCYETVWLILHLPFLVIISPLRNSGPCNSFYCLGHSKMFMMMMMMMMMITMGYVRASDDRH